MEKNDPYQESTDRKDEDTKINKAEFPPGFDYSFLKQLPEGFSLENFPADFFNNFRFRRQKNFCTSDYADRFCDLCKNSGRLMECKKCGRMAHLKCAMLKRVPDNGWLCNNCMMRINEAATILQVPTNMVREMGAELKDAKVFRYRGKLVVAAKIPELYKRHMKKELENFKNN